MNLTTKRFKLEYIFLHSWQPYFWFIFFSFLLYSQVLTFSDYTYYDDHFLIVESHSYIDKWADAGHAFFEDVSHQGQGGNLYRPIMTISLILSSQISGTWLFGYHLIDIILHCATCCLLFAVLQLLGFKRTVSFVGTLFFCVHPAMTQAVAWVAGRNDSLLAVFILSCLISFIKFLSTSSLKWYFFHLLFFMLAMLTKETSIVFPATAILYFYTLKGKKVFSITTILFLTGWIIVIVNWHILRSSAMITPVGNNLQAAALVLSNMPIALCYLGNIFWPFNLAFAPISSDIHITAGIISAGLLGLAFFLSNRKEWKFVFFGCFWFIVFLAPTFYYDLGFRTPPKFYDHRIYVPFMGILFVLLSFSFTGIERFIKRIIPYTIILVVCGLGLLSFAHTSNFKNSLALHEYDALTSPNDPKLYTAVTQMTIPKKLYNEIQAVIDSPQVKESSRLPLSKEELWQIIDNLKIEQKSSPDDPNIPHALAITCFARGLFLSSEENFHAAMKNSPNDANIPYNLGILYYTAHAKNNAEKAWLKALQLDSTMGNVYNNLSYLYYETGRYESALLYCQKAMQYGIQVLPEFVKELQKNSLKNSIDN
jgi:hypothetical protein